jgi:spore maturation protein CgeB
MRVLVMDTDYEPFLKDLYANSPGLEDSSYEEQMAVRRQSLFGIAAFYASGFKANGVEAQDLYLNNRSVQLRWAAEQGLRLSNHQGLLGIAKRWFGPRARLSPELAAMPGWAREVLAAQIEQFQPDVILNQAMEFIGAGSLRTLAGKKCLLVGQIAAPWHDQEDDRNYDLIISSLPNFVSRFEGRGVRSRFNALAFSPRVLAEVPSAERDLTVSFVGTMSIHHMERIKLLAFLAERINLNVWGMMGGELPSDSPIWACYRGHAWGREMFSIFRRSRIVINQHIGIAGEFANNMRLYEATGCGAAFVTDRKANLHDLFEVGAEVVDYGDPFECLQQIERLLRDTGACIDLGRAGQARTCRDHTYEQRAAELVAIFAGIG